MIISFYDKDLNPLLNNSSLNVGTWSLKRKAVDLDEFQATSEPFYEDINPTFVIMSDDVGKYKYGALAGIPQINKNNQAEIQATDLKSLLKNKIYIKFNTYTSVKDLFNDLTQNLDEQVHKGSISIQYDFIAIDSILLDDNLFPDNKDYQVIDVWEDILVPYMKYYDLFVSSKIDLKNKKVIFTFSKINEIEKSLHLYEFDVRNYGKWIASLNECEVIVKNDNISKSPTSTFILLSDNTITTDLSRRDLYPIKKEIILKETNETDVEKLTEIMKEGVVECIENLVGARYNESIEINVNNTPYENDEFNTTYSIFTEKNKFYKKLPIGIISESNKANKTITIGYKDDDIILYL